jgi:hypothetical protein
VEAETRSGRSGSTWDFHGISMGFLVGFWWLMVSELCFIDPIFLGDRKLRYIEKKTFHAWDVKWFHAVFFFNGYLTINL